MRVYYVSSGLEGCYTVRCLYPLQANGWDGDKTSFYHEYSSEDKAQFARRADVVVFHRPDDPKKLELAKILKKLGKKIVYDNDDTFKDDGGFQFNEYMNEKRVKKGLKKINETLDEFVQFADVVTCSTDFLKKEYSELVPEDKITVLPNCIDPFYFDEPKRNDNGKKRIGVVGSPAMTGDAEILIPILQHFDKRDDVELVMFSMPPKGNKIHEKLYKHEYEAYRKMNLEWHPFVPMSTYYETLNNLRLDLMIIPRKDNYFNRCKSNLKFLEASMFEIPVLAQGFPTGDSPYQGKDEEYMTIVTDDWIGAVETALQQDLQDKARHAREYVEANYDINKNAHLWQEAYAK
jgi:glycosyltransferase involved in cell wall biosynthesis